ncbi:MAG: hypothetical protein HQM12_18775 [SAR324 cluster bacterium]|nr:hypothetical protein [SAR324 cluster bacterium]
MESDFETKVKIILEKVKDILPQFGKCACPCHENPGVKHGMPCCPMVGKQIRNYD